MLAGCSSTLLSPRHRLISTEASAQFQTACHYPMSTQRLHLPCSFPRNDVSRPQSVRPVGISVEKPIEAKTLKQSIRSPTQIKAKGKNLKRRGGYFEEDDDDDESCFGRAKRKKGRFDSDEFSPESKDSIDLSNLGSAVGNIWVQQPGFGIVNVNYPKTPFYVSCSGEGVGGEGEERRVCLAPTDVISSPPRMPHRNTWVESSVTDITEYDEGDKDTTSGSSSSSESHSFLMGGGPTTGLMPHNTDDYQGFELIGFLMGCVEAIGSRNIEAINHFIAKLGEQASPRARSPISRLTAYFTEALALRVTRFWPHIFNISIPRELDRFDDEFGACALRLLNQISPNAKFIHFTANEMLLRAFEGKDKVHIIDFDIKQGLQWPGLLQTLASRENPPSHVRITGVGESKQDLIETGERLAGFAEAFNIPFEFHPVVDRLEDVRQWMLHVKEGESVAVNCIFQLHKILNDTNGGSFRDFMGLIRSTSPTALIMAEQEVDHNEPTFELRVCNSLKYYAALFDVTDSSLPHDSPSRVKIEEMFGREIRNIIACEEGDRVERHESFAKWKRRMEGEGFGCVKTTDREVVQSKMLLRMYSNERYNVEETQGKEGIILRWLDQPLYTVSLWAPQSSSLPF